MDTELWYAYCAAFMDAEGSFCISRVSMAKWGFQDNHRLIVDISQHVARRDVLDDFQATFGGGVRIKRQNSKAYVPLKPIANWHLQKRSDVERFTRAIYPYLRCKRLQAEIALEFLAEAGTSEAIRLSSGFGGRMPLTTAQIQVREALRLRMRAANGLSKYPALTATPVPPILTPACVRPRASVNVQLRLPEPEPDTSD